LSAMISRFQYRDLKQQGKKGRKEDFCEDWIYATARALAGYNLNVSGLHPRDALELARQKGILPQREWNSLKGKPKKKGESLDKILKNYQIQVYSGVNQENPVDVKQALVTFGPLLAAIFVYPEWEICDGIMQMPAPNQAAIGRHSIVIVGYNDVNKRYKIRNSWGAWGADGYAEMSYDVLKRCCFSLWSAIDLQDSKDLYPLNPWEESVSKWPQWLKDAFGIPL
jgi:C1A family cysteine protease